MHTSILRIRLAAGAMALAGAFTSVTGFADTATVDLNVSATVVAMCTASTNPVAFGNYDPISVNATADKDVVAAVNTTCTIGSAPTIALGDGLNYAGGDRRLRRGATSDYLLYELYSDAGRTTVWDGVGVAATTPSGTLESNSVYARLFSGQNTAAVGSYADTVVATITY